jgi:hypothetical protein
MKLCVDSMRLGGMELLDLERFLTKFIFHYDCWFWVAGRFDSGYGAFWLGGRTRRAHRVAYEYFVGPIPEGLRLDHLCRNRGCVNPYHLEPVTDAVNHQRGDTGMNAFNKAKTHCVHGHRLSGENLLTYPLKRGRRECRACHNSRQRIS